jgi:uncharacterized membrane protein
VPVVAGLERCRSATTKARVKARLEILGDLFWLRPALVVLICILLAQFGVWLETAHVASFDPSSPDTNWGYSGGAEGARALLSAIAASNIDVAGTTFSITIDALTLASGQMGPRFLRNFIRDARNQTVLGIFLGTFADALMVLRTVRTVEENPFVPHLAITGALLLALVAVGTLVWFVHDIAKSINIETVVDAVRQDLCRAIPIHTRDEPGAARPEDAPAGQALAATAGGYVQAIDEGALADWAQERGITVDEGWNVRRHACQSCVVEDRDGRLLDRPVQALGLPVGPGMAWSGDAQCKRDRRGADRGRLLPSCRRCRGTRRR